MPPENLRLRIEEARAALHRANEEYRRLTQVAQDVTDPANPDGILALRKSLEIHRRKRAGYENARQQFIESLSGRYRRIHLKTRQERRLTLCGIWVPENFLLLEELTEATANVCRICSQIARTSSELRG